VKSRFVQGMNPRPTARMSFSASCEVGDFHPRSPKARDRGHPHPGLKWSQGPGAPAFVDGQACTSHHNPVRWLCIRSAISCSCVGGTVYHDWHLNRSRLLVANSHAFVNGECQTLARCKNGWWPVHAERMDWNENAKPVRFSCLLFRTPDPP